MRQTATQPTAQRAINVWTVLGLPLLAVALVIGGTVLYQAFQRPAAPSDPQGGAPINSAIEAKWGVRFKMVAITADGGLIDMRYLVIDPEKAQAMMNSLDTLPAIVKSDGSVDFRLQRPMNHKNELQAGQSSYILYVNKANGLKRGDSVAIVVGDMRVEPVVVK